MNFKRTSFEPAPATGGEVWGLVDFGDPEGFLIERSGFILTSNRHRELDMIKEKDLHEAHTSLMIGDTHLGQIIRYRQFAADSRMYLIERNAGGDLAQAESVAYRLEQAIVGRYQLHHPARRHRQRTLRNEARRPTARDLLHDDEDAL